jgi:hypothetical protein
MEQISVMPKMCIGQQQMPVNQSKNQVNSIQQVDSTSKPDTFESIAKIEEAKKEQEKSDKKAKIKKILAIGAAIAAVGLTAYAIYKGRGVKLSSINFDKGTALTKSGKKFTGVIKDKLKNGDKVVMKYVDGVLQKSTVSGKENFEKVYKVVNGGLIVTKTANGITTELDIGKMKNEAIAAQAKLKEILKDNKLSSDELKKETDAIKFKSNNQKKEIESLINHKKQIENEAKIRLEAEAKAAKNAELAQMQYNNQFEGKLFNKSAKESADIFKAEAPIEKVEYSDHYVETYHNGCKKTVYNNGVTSYEYPDGYKNSTDGIYEYTTQPDGKGGNYWQKSKNGKVIAEYTPDGKQIEYINGEIYESHDVSYGINNLDKITDKNGNLVYENVKSNNISTDRYYGRKGVKHIGNYRNLGKCKMEIFDKNGKFLRTIETNSAGMMSDSDIKFLVSLGWKGAPSIY